MHKTIGVIGLGYVGLPLAKEFAKIFKVIAYDTNLEKIKQFEKLKHKNLFFSNDIEIKPSVSTGYRYLCSD